MSESRAHLVALGALLLGLGLTAWLEWTDDPRDALPGWFLLVWPFVVVVGDVTYANSGDPTGRWFVPRGMAMVFGFHVLLAGVQAVTYVLPDPEYAAWTAARPPDADPLVVETWIVAVAHVAGIFMCTIVAGVMRGIRRLWAGQVDVAAD